MWLTFTRRAMTHSTDTNTWRRRSNGKFKSRHAERAGVPSGGASAQSKHPYLVPAFWCYSDASITVAGRGLRSACPLKTMSTKRRRRSFSLFGTVPRSCFFPFWHGFKPAVAIKPGARFAFFLFASSCDTKARLAHQVSHAHPHRTLRTGTGTRPLSLLRLL